MKNKLQITHKDINSVKNFNLPLLQEATRQTELKIQDENERKYRIDNRAYSLLTVCLGIIGIIAASVSTEYLRYSNTVIFLTVNITGVLIIASAFLLFQTLKSKTYGSIGTYPHSWLSKEYIKDYDNASNNNNYMFGIATARILLAFEDNIIASNESNSKRLKLLNLSLLLCQVTLLPFGIFFTLNIIYRLL
jgi:hypothetical protein